MKSFLKKHLKKVIIIGVILLIATFSVFRAKAQEGKEEIVKFDPKKEIVIQVERQTIKDEIILTGSIDASEKASLRFQASGKLAWVGVKEGDTVRKYQALASLDRTSLKKKLQADFNTYRSALATFDDTQDTYKDEKDNLILTDDMKRILVRAQNTLDNSVINYELQELTLKYSTLITPIAGVVTNIDQPSSGVNITPATATFSIINPESIYFKAQIDQEDVVRIKVGDMTVIRLDSFSDQDFESEITHINFTPVAGQSSTVYEVHFKLPVEDNQDLKYRIGMDGDAIIYLRESNDTLVIPIDALHQNEEEEYVMVKEADNNILVKKYVKTGIEDNYNIEVLEGLSENDQIVTFK